MFYSKGVVMPYLIFAACFESSGNTVSINTGIATKESCFNVWQVWENVFVVCSELFSYWGYGLGVEMVACVLVR